METVWRVNEERQIITLFRSSLSLWKEGTKRLIPSYQTCILVLSTSHFPHIQLLSLLPCASLLGVRWERVRMVHLSQRSPSHIQEFLNYDWILCDYRTRISQGNITNRSDRKICMGYISVRIMSQMRNLWNVFIFLTSISGSTQHISYIHCTCPYCSLWGWAIFFVFKL